MSRVEAKTAQKRTIEPTPAKKSKVNIPEPARKISSRKITECQDLQGIQRLIERVIDQQEAIQGSIERLEDMLSQDPQGECSIVEQAKKLRLKE